MTMKIQHLAKLTLGAALALAAIGAQACGEVMYRMGGALHYRAFITKHPAQILLYQNSSQPPADTEQFHRNLEKAGHRVTLTGSPGALAQALAEHSFDVIIAYAADLPTVNAEIEKAARTTTLIPVFAHDSDEQGTRQRYPLALSENSNLNAFLKTIEKSMKARGT
jgi:hypothetical protein